MVFTCICYLSIHWLRFCYKAFYSLFKFFKDYEAWDWEYKVVVLLLNIWSRFALACCSGWRSLIHDHLFTCLCLCHVFVTKWQRSFDYILASLFDCPDLIASYNVSTHTCLNQERIGSLTFTDEVEVFGKRKSRQHCCVLLHLNQVVFVLFC